MILIYAVHILALCEKLSVKSLNQYIQDKILVLTSNTYLFKYTFFVFHVDKKALDNLQISIEKAVSVNILKNYYTVIKCSL